MNPLRIASFYMGILVVAAAYSGPRPLEYNLNANSIKHSLRAKDWVPISELESLPSMHELTIKKLEEMSLQDGAEWIQKMYHLSQAGRAFQPSYAPKASEISAYYYTPNNEKIAFKLNELPKIAKENPNFGTQEVTFHITGLPEKSETIRKAHRKLAQAYMQRYNGQSPAPQNTVNGDDSNEMKSHSSSEEGEDYYRKNQSNEPSGNFVTIELGILLEDMHKYANLDVERTGMEIGNVLVQWTDMSNVPHEIVHIIGSNIGAHVAGATGRHFTRETGHQLRRITGLDPSRILAQTDKALKGLARGDAEFVDAIHTSAYGMGTPTRSGDIDFYPNGPSEGVPGADNVVEASMRAVRYFAESVIPGNERNFPAIRAISLKQYKQQNGSGKRAYMGINTDYDMEGDFILQVNSKSPFGRSAPAQQQQGYHNVHKPSKSQSRDYN